MLRIVITGAESSGKSTLTKFLAAHFQVPFAMEYARIYMEENGAEYDAPIVHKMARLHLAYQLQQVPKIEPIGIFDTDLINFKIWCDVAFGGSEAWLREAAAAENHHVYLLCRPDIPWEADPLREYPNGREKLFEKHLAEVIASGRDYEIIEGVGEQREKNAIAATLNLLQRSGFHLASK